MTEEQARCVLGDSIQPDNSLYSLGAYIAWSPGDAEITLDGTFTWDELLALTWWMEHYGR